VGNIMVYEAIIIGGVLLGCLIPWGVFNLTAAFKKPA
jgi:hypothetical protein